MNIKTATAQLTEVMGFWETEVNQATILPGGITDTYLALQIGTHSPWDLTPEQKEILSIQAIDEEFGTVSFRVNEYRRNYYG